MRGHRLAIVISFVAFLCVAVRSQEPPPVSFKAEVNFVEVGAIATDAQGRFVSSLGRDDFQILEDGRPQKIAALSLVDIALPPLPASTRDLLSVEPDVVSNARGLQGRLYLIVLDDLHTSLSRTALVKATARRFIERSLAPTDVAAVVTTSGRTDGLQDFTSNRRLLLDGVEAFVGQKLRSGVLEKLDNYRQQVDLTGRDPGQQGKPINDAYDIQRGQRARNALLTIRDLANALAPVHGRRKAMVYISEGIDYTTTNFEEWREISGNARTGVSIDDALRDAITAASRANVSIYSIDPRGLTNLGDVGIEINSVPEDPNLRLDAAGLLEELRVSQASLRVLAEQTGGAASVNTNDLDGALDRIVRDNSSYYMLGYYPTNDKRDGRFRRIEVRVNRPGITVRARKGYILPRSGDAPRKTTAAGEGSPELADALSRPIQTAGLTLHANTVAFRGPAPNASVAVAVTVGGDGFTFKEKDGWIEDKLEVSVRAIDRKGTIRGSEHFDLNIRVRSESRPVLVERGFRAISRLEMPPGRYRLQIGAREAGGGALGTIFTDLEVPDFASAPVGLSSIMITSVMAGGVPTGRAETLKDRLPIVPLPSRDFRTSDELVMFAEVYDNEIATPHTLDFTASILSEDRATTFLRLHEQRTNAQLAADSGRFRYGRTVPLKDLAPGTYLVRIEAASRLNPERNVAQEVRFRVIP